MRRSRNHFLWIWLASAASACKPDPVAQPAHQANGIRAAGAALKVNENASALKTDPNPPGQTSLLPNMERLPQEVLVGTDVEPLSRYLAQAQPVQPGKYSVEIGGALLQARITTGAAPSLKRQFKEPGLKASNITYSSLRALGSSLVSERVQIVGLPDAVLVFEENSGLEGIPNTMWIRYERKGGRP